MANQLGNIGGVYQEKADYPNALNYYFRALKIDEGLEIKTGCAPPRQHRDRYEEAS